jgi:hypothetical protein
MFFSAGRDNASLLFKFSEAFLILFRDKLLAKLFPSVEAIELFHFLELKIIF